jgi:hypothetical protein
VWTEAGRKCEATVLPAPLHCSSPSAPAPATADVLELLCSLKPAVPEGAEERVWARVREQITSEATGESLTNPSAGTSPSCSPAGAVATTAAPAPRGEAA